MKKGEVSKALSHRQDENGAKLQSKAKKCNVSDQEKNIIESLSDQELYEIFRCQITTQSDQSMNTDSEARKSLKNDSCELNDISSTELKFERLSAPLKAKLLHSELTIRAKSLINTALSNIRSTEHSLRVFTETSKARKALAERIDKMGFPQELIQCVMRMAQSKMKIKHLISAVQQTIKSRPHRGNLSDRDADTADNVDVVGELMQWYMNQEQSEPGKILDCGSNSSLHRRLFPEGNLQRRRFEPRTDEAEEASKATDSSGVSLDDLRCSCCHDGHASTENDLLLCDGMGCYRAFHMHCLEPKVTPEEVAGGDDDNWFCPLCTAHATLVHYTQQEYLGDEWENVLKSNEKQYGNYKDCQSHLEWETADDVFPEAISELRVAQKMREGIQDDETNEFLSETFGITRTSVDVKNDFLEHPGEDEEENDEDFEFGVQENDESDDDSLAEDMDEEKNLLNEKIEDDELDALSVCLSIQGSDNDMPYSDGDLDGTGSIIRPRRSKRKKATLPHERSDDSSSEGNQSSSKSGMQDMGKLDTANIVHGKRSRTKVDYQK